MLVQCLSENVVFQAALDRMVGDHRQQRGIAMHKILSTTLLLALTGVSLNAASDQDRVAMCHKGKDFNFVAPSVQAHLNHGDTKGSCENGSGDGDIDGMTIVVRMRCDAVDVVSFNASVEFASIQPVEGDNCAVAASRLFENDFKLRSVTSGSGGSEALRMLTDYLFLGEEPDDSDDSDDSDEPEESEDD